MKQFRNLGIMVASALLIVGIGIFFINRQRNAPVNIPPKYVEKQLTDDDIVQPRKLYIDDLKSAKALDGKTVWIKLGYELDSYPYVGGHADYAHPAGNIPGAQPLMIETFVTQKAPESLATRVAHGDKQVLAVFTEPGSPKKFAAPIGYIKSTDSKFYCDDFFYYDDPHQLYKHWPADVWQSIDKHEAKVGMSELQTSMALGEIQESDSQDFGNRQVRYNLNGKFVDVQFANGKA
ncbi:MAG TPA: hypothetical protein VGD64_03450, partial [Acidisarcina sp.]